MVDGPITADGVRVCADLCSTCVFRPGNLMRLRDGRVRGMVNESLAKDSAIICHKTLDGERAICRGFYNGHHRDTLLCRLTFVLGRIDLAVD